ncbi:uncharacterized protein LOC119996700 isoform X1 [Tripterygium wilfordii]|uniref:uncharacterized protein LOC119996700 isoform X1 n=2 Tax=Tripterygium wilfordii TaxID=458696 RepID=UPI0018F7FA9F|nr:uncharacterized protein LOC119996700 isoform X1 [Tripterygium wilfordii]XP_038699358.1 uncharacterized protein LOC119996700 isoform X1 [Tripterygium wilfordii]
MAFDQNSIAKDPVTVNATRTVTEEPRIAATITSGRNTAEGGFASSGSIPVYYPATVPDAGYVTLGYGAAVPPGVTAWAPRMPVPVGSVSVNPAVGGFGYGPSLGNRVVGNAVDHSGSDMGSAFVGARNLGDSVNGNGSDQEEKATRVDYNPNLVNKVGSNGAEQVSEGGGNDSVSGKKVKFLCSFGGKILPRPSDGTLRYVGGQTRIISIKREASFNELMQKMVDIYGQPVIIKYQLPDEDLDALVSVSCPDDLENMMDEYEKLSGSFSDGSAKLRMFLFSASELDSSGVVQFGDLHDGGQKYVDAVNGVVDGVGSTGITRKESMASANSTQNSDISGAETGDCSGLWQGDTTGLPSTCTLSPSNNSATSHDAAPKLMCIDPNPAAYTDASTAPLGIPVVKSGPPQTSEPYPEVEVVRPVPVAAPHQQLGYDFHQPGKEVPQPGPHMQAYVDSRPEVMNNSGFIHLPSQMGFPNSQLFGNAGAVFTQQQLHDNLGGVTHHQFIPAVHMTVASSSHAPVRPTVVQPLVQPQQTRFEQYPNQSTVGPRVVQLPFDPTYNMYKAQVPSQVVGGGYGWHQVQSPETGTYTDGKVPHQQVIFTEKILRLQDCYMCQNVLPHAHSDTLPQDRKVSGANPLYDSSSAYQSLRSEDAMRFHSISSGMVTGISGDDVIDQRAGARAGVHYQVGTPQADAMALSHNLDAQNGNEGIVYQKTDNSDRIPMVSASNGVMGLAGDVNLPYGKLLGTMPQSSCDDATQKQSVPTYCQVKQEPLNKLINNDIPHVGGLPIQSSERLIQEPAKDFSGKISGLVPKEDTIDSCVSHDHLRPIDGMMEPLQIHPAEICVNKEQNRAPTNTLRKEDILNYGPQPTTGRDALFDNSFSNPQIVRDANHCKPTEVLPSSSEAMCYGHNYLHKESHEAAQLPLLVDPAFSGVESTYVIDRPLPVSEWKDEVSCLQPKIVPSDVEGFTLNGNILSSPSPSSRPVDVVDSSNSLFSNQDPWALRHDTHFPPPRPTKIAVRKEAFVNRDPVVGNHLGSSGEPSTDTRLDDGAFQPLSNLNRDYSLEQARSSKGSEEDLIKKELQAVAENVAASVFQSSTSSNPDLSAHDINESAFDTAQGTEVSNYKDVKTKISEKVNFGFPVSDGIGRLQIIQNSDLEELRELGSGTFGTVYHGKWRGTDVAIKRINDRCFAGKPSEQERMRDDFWNEAIKLADLHHPNVVAFYGVVLDGPGGSIATVTEYMVNGSLRNALQKNVRSLSKRKLLLIAMDVAFGMEYLHGKKIVHFDLKSDNLLVNLRDPHRPICKVGDLGLSKVKCQTLISGGVRGTLPWMAPELLNGSSSLVSEKVDVFSYGIVMWELLTGEEPYADLHYGAIIGGIVSNTLRPPIPESCDPDWKSLMERCWSSEPSERPSFTEIANDLRIMAAKLPPKGQNPPQ